MATPGGSDHPEADAERFGVGRRWSTYAAVVAMVGLGVAASVLALVIVLYATFESGAGTVAVFSMFAVLTLLPAVLLWWTRGRRWRAFGLGLAASCVGVGFYFFVWHPSSTMSADEVTTAEHAIRASGHPAVYLGDEVDGHQLNDYYLAGSQASFFYGECHSSPDDSEGGCSDWDVSVHNVWEDVTVGGDAIAGCVRQDPVAGVPTVYLHDEDPDEGVNEVALFTGDSEVRVELAADSNTGLEQILAKARAARLVGESEPSTRLPTPRASILAYVEANCGAAP
jgi:hypothetical protein